MRELGERLRAARESQGISISQAAVETRILQRYLVALEEGDFQYLPGDVYARGFIRNYAQYLDIPAEELIESYRQDRGITDPIRVVPATSSPRIRGFFIPSFFGVFFVVLALIGLSYLGLNAANYIGENSRLSTVVQPTAVPTPPSLPTNVPELTRSPEVAMLASPTTLGLAGVAPTPQLGVTPTPDAPIVAEVRVYADSDPATPDPGSWLHVKVDGTTVFQKTLGAGQSLRYTAQRDLWIRAGNAAVVSVIVNGEEHRLGVTPGDVADFSWPPR